MLRTTIDMLPTAWLWPKRWRNGFYEFITGEKTPFVDRHPECNGECYNIRIGYFNRCIWCKFKALCIDDCGELADRDSEFCRHIYYHYGDEK